MSVVAIPTYRRRVAPTFDFSTKVLVFDPLTEEGAELLFQGLSDTERINALSRAGVAVLICGGISDGLLNMLKSRGVEVICGIAGPVEEVVKAYRADCLDEARFQMPGTTANIEME